MVFGYVESREVVKVVLHLRARVDLETGAREDRDHSAQRAPHGMQAADSLAPARQRNVDRLTRELRGNASAVQRLLARLYRADQGFLRAVDVLAGCGDEVRRQLTELAQLQRENALLAEILDAQCIELR